MKAQNKPSAYDTTAMLEYLLGANSPEGLVNDLKDLYISVSRIAPFALQKGDSPVSAQELSEQLFSLLHTIEAIKLVKAIE